MARTDVSEATLPQLRLGSGALKGRRVLAGEQQESDSSVLQVQIQFTLFLLPGWQGCVAALAAGYIPG